MPDAELASSPRWRFSDTVPTVDAQYCLNGRHKAAACTRCATACPVQAITLLRGTPSLEAERCVNCGVCQVSCPTDVFREPFSKEAKLAQTIAQTPPTVSLVCPLKAVPEFTSAPVAAIVRHKRCLAALSTSDLLALAQKEGQEIWLDDSPCATCPLAAAQQILRASVASAQNFLQALNSQAHIELYSEHTELANVKPERHPLFDGMQPKISRRRLFGLADTSTHMPARADREHDQAILEGSHLSPRVPPSHQRLLAHLRRMSPEGEPQLAAASLPFATVPFATVPFATVPFVDVEVDAQACSACRLCARFCPTAALQFDSAAQEFAIRFRADRCIGCDLCKIACPEDAIHIGETISVERLLVQDNQVLIAGELAACSVCGAETAVRDEVRLCHSCRHGAGVVQPLRDEAGLMADLLSQIASMSKFGN